MYDKKVCNQMCILIQCIDRWCACIGHIQIAMYDCHKKLPQVILLLLVTSHCSKTRPNFVWSIPGSSILGPMIIDLDPSMPSTITVRTNYEHLSLIFPEKLLNERALAKFYWFLNIVNKKACNTAVKVCNQMCILIQCIVSWCTCIGHIITAGYNRHKS